MNRRYGRQLSDGAKILPDKILIAQHHVILNKSSLNSEDNLLIFKYLFADAFLSRDVFAFLAFIVRRTGEINQQDNDDEHGRGGGDDGRPVAHGITLFWGLIICTR